MGLLKTIKRFLFAKSTQASEYLEDSNITAFAQLEVTQLKKDHAQAIMNVAKVEGRIGMLEQDIKELELEVKNRTLDVKTLLSKKKDNLAQRVCARIETCQQEMVTLKDAHTQQKELAKELEDGRDELAIAVDEVDNQLRIMKTMSNVIETNESLGSINTNNSKSAINAFKDQRKRLQEKLLVTRSVTAQTTSLEKDINTVVGKVPGQDTLAKIKKGLKK